MSRNDNHSKFSERPSSRIDTNKRERENIFPLVMRTLRTYSLNFPVYHMAALATVIMLYTTSLVFILYLEVCIFWSPSPISPSCLYLPPLGTTMVTTNLTLFLWGFFCFCFKIPHISKIIQYLSYSVWLISLSIMPSRSIHVVANDRISLSF